ncbi:Protein of unknown function DUF247, plant [Dillenia turbinata]|uniref:Uncharacterized protein n=1 Tax=Dillenia turbinata TaxID=194707 RepID=A0AAN8ULZ1_9MAGN
MATVLVDAQQSGISKKHEGEIPSKEEAVFIEIRELLEKSRTVAATKERHYISRISAPIRDLNAASYTPMVVAVGPYHFRKAPKAGEDIKNHYLQLVLGGKNDEDNRKIITGMSSLINAARECYAESTETISDQEFLKMMLFDSCFIVEIIRRFYAKEQKELNEHVDDDPIFIDETTRSTIRRDLVLFENQLPFFVLQKFYDLTIETKSDTLSLCKMALDFVDDTIPGSYCVLTGGDPYEPKHLLGLLYDSLARIKDPYRSSRVGPCGLAVGLCCLFLCSGWLGILLMVLLLPWTIFLIFKALLISICCPYSPPSGNENELISCSMSLHEKGVKFRKMVTNGKKTPTKTQEVDKEKLQEVDKEKKQEADKGKKQVGSLFDVEFSFDDGTLTVPTLTINSNTKAIFLNLLAYERYCRPRPGDKKYVRDYMALMDCLIDSSDDVKILCKHGIFENSSRDNEEITKLFDRPKDDFIIIDPKNFVYKETFKSINCYCNQRWTYFVVTWSKWMAKLRAKYFDSPWTLISLLAAIILLALTVVQTIYTLLAYYY